MSKLGKICYSGWDFHLKKWVGCAPAVNNSQCTKFSLFFIYFGDWSTSLTFWYSLSSSQRSMSGVPCPCSLLKLFSSFCTQILGRGLNWDPFPKYRNLFQKNKSWEIKGQNWVPIDYHLYSGMSSIHRCTNTENLTGTSLGKISWWQTRNKMLK